MPVKNRTRWIIAYDYIDGHNEPTNRSVYQPIVVVGDKYK
jgi:hypothetical protein